MTDEPTGSQSSADDYEIRVRGHLAPRWAARFDGMTLTAHDDGTTAIHGPVPDQSALHGLIRALGDLGLPLVSVTQPRHPAPEEHDMTTDPTTDTSTAAGR
jgi:hypothetical protein